MISITLNYQLGNMMKIIDKGPLSLPKEELLPTSILGTVSVPEKVYKL